MSLQWTEKLAIGDREIDDQHKELFTRINGFLEAMRNQQGKQEIGGMLGFLEKYVARHFETEERMMISSRYSGYLRHKSQHSQFQREFSDITRRFQERGPSLDIILASQTRLVDWLVTHIPHEDKAFATFLKSPLHKSPERLY